MRKLDLGARRKYLLPLFGLGLPSLLAGLLLSNASCSLIVKNSSATQCVSNSDCAALGGAFATDVCNLHNFCVAPQDYCTTNAQCNTAFPGQPAICRKSDNTCQFLFTTDGACYGLMDGVQQGHDFDVVTAPTPADIALLNNDNVILLGSMEPTTPAEPAGGALVGAGTAVEISTAMIMSQFYTELGGIPLTNGSRPVVVVACTDQSDGSKNPLTTGAHLAQDLQVPIIIGPLQTQAAYPLANSSAVLPAGTAMILPFDASSLTRTVPDSNLLFRLDPGDNWNDLTNAQIGKYVEPWIKRENNLTNIKLAITSPNDILSLSQTQQAEAELIFNGISPEKNGSNFQVISTGDGVPGNPQWPVAASAIADFAPNIIYISGEPTEYLLIPLFEKAWKASTPYKPWYTLTATGVSIVFGAPAEVITAPYLDSVRRRMLGQIFIPTPTGPYFANLQQYLLDYSAESGRTAMFPSNPGYAIAVDGVVLALISTVAAAIQQTPDANGNYPVLTGTEVAKAMYSATQPPNTTTLSYSDPIFFSDMMTALRASGGINYDGLSGPCDYDSQGDAWAEQSTVCLAHDTDQIPAFQPFWVDAPAEGQLFTAATQGQACFTDGGCANGVAQGAIDPGPGNPEAGAPGCNFGLSQFVVTGEGGLDAGGGG